MEITAARSLTLSALTGVSNAGFSEYVVPMQMTEAALAEHLDVNAIDLGCSQVLADPDQDPPVAFALIARRADEAWVGGVGTAPACRGRGLGERVLRAGVNAAAERGCGVVWLEVITTNRAAIALYEKLGFDHVRDLIVWSLPAPATPDAPPGARQVELMPAHDWIAAHRATREPWQRSDGALARQADRGDRLHAWVVERGGDIVAAAIVRDRDATAAVMQIATLDDAAAADAVRAAVRSHEDLRLANASVDEAASRALGALGARERLLTRRRCCTASGCVGTAAASMPAPTSVPQTTRLSGSAPCPGNERARSELRASGETARRRDAAARDELTPQELQIARLVVNGLSNPGFAAQLYLSPRTIDYHLRKVFAKLEISSRGDLAHLDLGEAMPS